MFITGLVKMPPARNVTVEAGDVADYGQLIHGIFKPGRLPEKKTSVVAFASASNQAGASFIVKQIGLELATYGKERTVIVDARRLEAMSKPELEKWAKLSLTAGFGVSWLKNEEVSSANLKSKLKKRMSLGQGDEGFKHDCLQLLRKYFNHVLIDCGSINAPASLTLMAELVDGVVVVVAAGQTRREEIQRAEQVVEMTHGKLLGFVINKRKYPVPDWLYRRM